MVLLDDIKGLEPTSVTKIKPIDKPTSGYNVIGDSNTTWGKIEVLPDWLFEPANNKIEQDRRNKIIKQHKKHKETCAKNRTKRKKKK